MLGGCWLGLGLVLDRGPGLVVCRRGQRKGLAVVVDVVVVSVVVVGVGRLCW